MPHSRSHYEHRAAGAADRQHAQGVPLINDFIHEQLGTRVVFGPKSLTRLPEEVSRLSAERVLVIATRAMKSHADILVERLGSAVSARIDGVAQHVPAEAAKEAVLTAGNAAADLVVCIGGGSATGLAKAVAKGTGRPILAVPTTYAGSEMTPIWGLTEGRRKTTGRDPIVLPRVVVYDPELTLSLPTSTSAASGMNALAHAAEGLYAADASPLVRLIAEEASRVLTGSLPLVIKHPDDLRSRSDALFGAWLAGLTLGSVRMGIHHTICHVLGGTFGLPHAGTHSAVLPHAIAFNAPAAPEAMAALAQCLSTDDPAGALWDLARRIGAPTALADLGFRREDTAAAATMVVEAGSPNPRPFATKEVHALLLSAQDGTRPVRPKEEGQL
jgi:alcohol dehydrogenase class IV